MHNVCRQILNFYSQSQDKLRKKNTHKLRVNGKLNILLKTFSFAYRKIFKEKNRQNKKRPWTISSFVATDQIYNCTMHQFWVLCSKYRRRAFDAHIYTHTHIKILGRCCQINSIRKWIRNTELRIRNLNYSNSFEGIIKLFCVCLSALNSGFHLFCLYSSKMYMFSNSY